MPPKKSEPTSVPFPQQRTEPSPMQVANHPHLMRGLGVAFIAGAALGIGATFAFTRAGFVTTESDPRYMQGFAAGQEAANAEAQRRITESGLVPERTELLRISGRVTAVAPDAITIEANVPPASPLDPAPPTTRTVRLTAQTAVRIATQKDAVTQRQEMEAYQAAFAAYIEAGSQGDDAPPGPERPEPISYQDASASQITVGAQVTVEAATDIRNAEQFDATVVTVAGRDPLEESAQDEPEVVE